VLAGAAIGLLPARTFGINLEARISPAWVDVTAGRLRAPPAEALASLRYAASSGAMWTLGAATALVDGPGVAAYRVFIGSGFGKRHTLPTRDVDLLGILKTTDLCPTELETVNGWRDDDGCPDRLGTLQIDVKFDGQPRSADAEISGESGTQSLRIGPQGLSIDAVPGTAWKVSAKDGCLTGTGEAVASEEGTSLVVEMRPHYDANVAITVMGPENKAVPEALVRWQTDRPECMPLGTEGVDTEGKIAQAVGSGTHTLVVTANGYNVIELPVTLGVGESRVLNVQLAPSKIVMERKEIRILEKVRFESGKAVLSPVSYGLLNEVAAVIESTKGIGRVEVGGHTDNRGGEEFNFILSQDRADAVVEYLVAQGVPRDQLIGHGYGESRPIDTNKTEAGREANRRVEFKLLDAPADPAPTAPTPPATVP
jgi:outer membrane protein OmpA-like peptidoglycan-associated protein